MNTPTITATKFWIGGLAEMATFSVVFARLLIGEKDHGVHSFLVPLRDIKTHTPLPGRIIGDCGEKLGLSGIDNGWLQLQNVRIPKK